MPLTPSLSTILFLPPQHPAHATTHTPTAYPNDTLPVDNAAHQLLPTCPPPTHTALHRRPHHAPPRNSKPQHPAITPKIPRSRTFPSAPFSATATPARTATSATTQLARTYLSAALLSYGVTTSASIARGKADRSFGARRMGVRGVGLVRRLRGRIR